MPASRSFCDLDVISPENPIFGAIAEFGVFISLACIYVTLAAPFIATVQILVYAGAIGVVGRLCPYAAQS
ncbi:MAG: NADH-quinone oxidoreductase subunit J [Chloracidobacterium sp.]|nr:NADH-quinone oxidoreductase subunit J [Chloracidobacterium sp.]